MDLYVKFMTIDRKLLEIVGVYPTYVFQAGAFLAGGLLFLRAPFSKKNLWGLFV